jgi:hypothetical protein
MLAGLRTIIPLLMIRATDAPRYQPVVGVDFVWSSDSWVHNIFRVYELIFWRKIGIRPEATSTALQNEDGTVAITHAFHTVEAALKYVENGIRNFFKLEWVPFRIYIPILVTTNGLPVFSSPYLFAIAFNAEKDNFGGPGTSLSTTSVSCATTNGLLVLAGFAGYNASGSVVNSMSCTDGTITIIDHIEQTVDLQMGLGYIIGTTTSSQTVTFGVTNSCYLNMCTCTYSGAKQTGQPDAHTTKGSSSGVKTYDATITTIADNCWGVFGAMIGDISGGTVTAGSNTYQRYQNAGQGTFMADTNASYTPAGSLTMGCSKATNDKYAACIASFSPYVPPGPTNVKTWDGVTQSTGIKTYEGVALASVKSVEGVT